MKVKVKSLRHHPKNAEIYSLDDLDDLASSIEDVGLLTPLVIDQHNQVISGNRRLACVQQLGWTDVEVSKTDINDDDAELFIVHHNKQRIKTYRELLNEYHTLNRIHRRSQGKRTDLQTGSVKVNRRKEMAEAIGLKETTLVRLLVVEKEYPELVDTLDKGTITLYAAWNYCRRRKKIEASFANANQPPIKKHTGPFRFYEKSSHQLAELDDGEVQTIFTSPPYWNMRSFGLGYTGLGMEDTHQEFVENLVMHLEPCWRVLSDEGSFFLNLGDTVEGENLLNIPHRVVIGLQDAGWTLRNTIVWKKSFGLGRATRKLKGTYEFIFHLVKTHQYLYQETFKPRKSENEKGYFVRRLPDGTISPPRISVPNPKGTNMGDFWDEDTVMTTVANQQNRYGDVDHPAPFPEQIVEIPILQTTKENDLVLDPFMGTGTVGKVARRMKRRFVGYDIRNYGGDTMVGD